MVQVMSRAEPTPAPSALADIDTTTPRRGAILVVEDRDDVRQGVAQLLELHGFLVFDAADGEQALAHLQSDPETLALVLLDLMLAGTLSGHDVRAQQLADHRLARVPTVIVSACEPDLSSRAQLQPDAWLEKPFRFEQLLDIVKRYVVPEPGGIVGDCRNRES